MQEYAEIFLYTKTRVFLNRKCMILKERKVCQDSLQNDTSIKL